MRHGGSSNRPGFEFINEVKTSSTATILIPFIFNASQTYMLEFGNLYMRVIKNGVRVTVSGVSAYAGGTTYAIGNLVVDGGVNYYCIQAGTGHTPASSAGYWYPLTGSIYEIPTPYATADLASLKYIQSADVVTITHKNYRQRELKRTSDTGWTLSEIVLAPTIGTPTSVSASGTAGSATEVYSVTAVASETYEESLTGSYSKTSVTSPATATPITVTWAAVSGALEYNIYRNSNGVAGFIGVAQGISFIDTGYTPDTANTPPIARDPFSGAGNYPAIATYIQQRLGFANTANNTEKIYLGKTGNFKNFSISAPLQDDDAVTFNMAGNQVNEVMHMINLGKLIVFTSGGEWSIEGDSAGTITPGAINPVQRSANGASSVAPIIINKSALYVQARGSVVRDLLNDIIEGYKGNDLTIFSAHLFDGHTITNWAFQQIPHSIIWAVRDDGVLLGLTYNKEQELAAWHRHDTDGIVEWVSVIPEGGEDKLYAVIKRTINGSVKRYIERLSSRQYTDIVDAKFMDSFLTYDGRNTNASLTMTVSVISPAYTALNQYLCTASSSYFASTEVTDEIFLTIGDETLRCKLVGTTGTGPYNAIIQPYKNMPASFIGVATAEWARAKSTITGLSHLEAAEVSAFGDGFVLSNPNNDSYVARTVSSGSVSFDRAHAVVHVGLPYLCDLETLNIDTSNSETVADKKMLVNSVSVFVEATRGLFVGANPPSDDTTDPLEGLYEYKARSDENYESPISLKTDVIPVNIESGWNSNGRVFIRQVDPLPMSVLAVIPAGLIPFKG
jgi:hypothetical protein